MKGAYKYIRAFAVWFLLAVLVGAVTGVVGALFHKTIAFVTEVREENGILLYLLPIAGILITAMYSLSEDTLSTNAVIRGIREGKGVSFLMVPFIFIGTALTHLTGGSAGREGAALQIGGGIGAKIGRIIKADSKVIGVLTVAGMAGAFSAIFTTPVTAAVFAIEVVTVGHMRYFQLMPCMLASTVAYMISVAMGNEALGYPSVPFEALSPAILIKVLLAAVSVSLMSSLFCIVLHKTESLMKGWVKNKYLRAFAGGTAVIALTLILGTTMYNGAGMDTIGLMLSGDREKIAAAMTGTAAFAFLIKTIMTSLTIGAGFKGGEIVPAFFTGATLGAVLGMLLKLDPSFSAALGMVGMFAGVTNCPMASVILGCELFGADGILYFAVTVAVGFIVSGRSGLYESQRLVYKKYGVDKEETEETEKTEETEAVKSEHTGKAT